MGNIAERGGQFYATLKAASTLNTTTSLDKLVYISGDETVALLTNPSQTAIGSIVDTQSDAVTVNLFAPTKRGVAGAAVTAGQKLTVTSGTGLLITLAGTLTGVVCYGVAIKGTAAANGIIEYMPLHYTSIVIA